MSSLVRSRRPKVDIDLKILTGLIVNDDFLKRIQDIIQPNLLRDPSSILITRWCQDYLAKYSKAPKDIIWNIFESKQATLSSTQIDAINNILENLELDTYFQDMLSFNVDYYLEQAQLLFRERAIEETVKDIKAYLSQSEVDEAENRLIKYKKIEHNVSNVINPFEEKQAFKTAFESKEEPLFLLPGPYGEIINPHLVREGFIAFLGREKIGKTWRMMDLATWALKARRNVAIFQLGDLSQNDYLVRLGVQLSGKSNLKRYCQAQNVPILDCYINQTAGDCPFNKASKTAVIDSYTGIPYDLETDIKMHTPCSKCYRKNPQKFKGSVWWTLQEEREPLHWNEAYDKAVRWARRHKATKRFRLATYPNSTLNVRGVERVLDRWEEMESFVPDVVLLDYADIMAVEDNGQRDARHQENDRWKALRRLSQERKCLLITVTQSTRTGHKDNVTLTAQDVSEEKRKLSHVTAFFALNQNDAEKQKNLIRVAPIMVREGAYSVHQQVCVIQHLESGSPYVASFWHHKYPKKKKEETE